GLERVSKEMPVVFPVHPRTRKAMDLLSRVLREGMIATAPLSYLDMLLLESRARFIVTDSGGVQKEALFFRVPCITVRNETEWIETVAKGWNTLVGADPLAIVTAVKQLKAGEDCYPYGAGDACRRIVDVLLRKPTQRKSDTRGNWSPSKLPVPWQGDASPVGRIT
ncbi:MAG: UDP-N-acetylglucosamine 2-epimerase, partial [Terriglobia bacterium]